MCESTDEDHSKGCWETIRTKIFDQNYTMFVAVGSLVIVFQIVIIIASWTQSNTFAKNQERPIGDLTRGQRAEGTQAGVTLLRMSQIKMNS